MLWILSHSFLSVGRHWPRFVVKTIAWALAFVFQQVDNLISEKNESSEYSLFIKCENIPAESWSRMNEKRHPLSLKITPAKKREKQNRKKGKRREKRVLGCTLCSFLNIHLNTWIFLTKKTAWQKRPFSGGTVFRRSPARYTWGCI